MLIDSHAHLDFPDFEGEIGAVLERAAEAGVTRIITVGTSVESSRRAVELAENHPAIYAVIGIHPGSAMEVENVPEAMAELTRLSAHPRVVAIGETGLDYYRLPGGSGDEPIKQAQAILFQQHLKLAAEAGLNVVVHQRGDCFQDTLNLLTSFEGQLRSVFHCFGGTPEIAMTLIERGHLVSFTGIVTFKNAPLMQACAASVPDGSFLVETDSPYLAPVPFRGKRCEPAFVRHTAGKVATLRGQPLEHIAEATTAAAQAFFRFTS